MASDLWGYESLRGELANQPRWYDAIPSTARAVQGMVENFTRLQQTKALREQAMLMRQQAMTERAAHDRAIEKLTEDARQESARRDTVTERHYQDEKTWKEEQAQRARALEMGKEYSKSLDALQSTYGGVLKEPEFADAAPYLYSARSPELYSQGTVAVPNPNRVQKGQFDEQGQPIPTSTPETAPGVPVHIGANEFIGAITPQLADSMRAYEARKAAEAVRAAGASAAARANAKPPAPAKRTAKEQNEVDELRALYQAAGEYDQQMDKFKDYFGGFAGPRTTLAGVVPPGGTLSKAVSAGSGVDYQNPEWQAFQAGGQELLAARTKQIGGLTAFRSPTAMNLIQSFHMEPGKNYPTNKALVKTLKNTAKERLHLLDATAPDEDSTLAAPPDFEMPPPPSDWKSRSKVVP